jgi:putative membrane protein
VAVFTAAALIGLPGAALAAAPSTQDTTYLTSNIQTSLAEVTIGNLALSKSDDEGVRELADMTIADHTAALAKATALAQQLGIPVPTEPSAEQKAQAAQLEAASGTAFDQLYAQIQVAGHTKSVASTNTEISSGSEQSVIQYATEYLPVATHHLEMSQEVLDATGGSPTAVPAGTGGEAAGGIDPAAGWLVGLGVLAAAGGVLLLRGRGARQQSH